MKIRFSFCFTTLLLLLVTYFKAYPQVSFLQADTAVWRFRGFVHYNPCFHIDWQYMLTNQDTVVGIHTYRKMYQLGHQLVYLDCVEPLLGSTTPQYSIPLLRGLIREEGRKVYFWPTSYDSEYLAYDFDQQVGDTIPLYLPQIVTISLIEEIVLNGKTLKQYILGPITNPIDTIIEGIGTNAYPFLNTTEVVNQVNLVCYSRDDTVYYHRYDSCGFFEYPPVTTSLNANPIPNKPDSQIVKSIFPNPATTLVTIILRDACDYVVELCDIIGRINLVEQVQNKTEMQMDLSSLQAGAYLVYIKKKETVVSVKKLIVLH